MAKQLTAKERKTLNDAWAIISECTPVGSSWTIDSARYAFSPEKHHFGVTYFDTNEGASRGQYNWVRGASFADKVQAVLDIEASALENRDKAKAQRVEQLRKELANLTEQVPA